MLHYHEVTVTVVRCFAMEMLLLLFPKTEKYKSIVELNSLRSGSGKEAMQHGRKS